MCSTFDAKNFMEIPSYVLLFEHFKRSIDTRHLNLVCKLNVSCTKYL